MCVIINGHNMCISKGLVPAAPKPCDAPWVHVPRARQGGENVGRAVSVSSSGVGSGGPPVPDALPRMTSNSMFIEGSGVRMSEKKITPSMP